jgi:hypothetical protein
MMVDYWEDNWLSIKLVTTYLLIIEFSKIGEKAYSAL